MRVAVIVWDTDRRTAERFTKTWWDIVRSVSDTLMRIYWIAMFLCRQVVDEQVIRSVLCRWCRSCQAGVSSSTWVVSPPPSRRRSPTCCPCRGWFRRSARTASTRDSSSSPRATARTASPTAATSSPSFSPSPSSWSVSQSAVHVVSEGLSFVKDRCTAYPSALHRNTFIQVFIELVSLNSQISGEMKRNYQVIKSYFYINNLISFSTVTAKYAQNELQP